MNIISNYPSKSRGMVLVIVLWIITLLAMMAGTFAYSMRIETRLATSAVERAQARALAAAGVAYALAWQLDYEANRTIWPPNGDVHTWSFGGGQVQIQVTDGLGLVNLNTADSELFKKLLAGAGMAGDEAQRLADAMIEWRQFNSQSAERGLTARTQIHPLKSARFESIEELQQIPGMTPAIYVHLAEWVTPFSHHISINPELASAGLLQALGLDEQATTHYIAARAQAAAESAPPPPLPTTSEQIPFSGGTTNIYHVSARAVTASGTAAKIQAVADPRGLMGGQNLRLLAWREGH